MSDKKIKMGKSTSLENKHFGCFITFNKGTLLVQITYQKLLKKQELQKRREHKYQNAGFFEKLEMRLENWRGNQEDLKPRYSDSISSKTYNITSPMLFREAFNKLHEESPYALRLLYRSVFEKSKQNDVCDDAKYYLKVITHNIEDVIDGKKAY